MPVLTLDDAAIAWDRAGEGDPAIVLVHGGMCDSRDWDPVMPLLAARHAVIRLDLRAHGGSGGSADGLSVESWAADLAALVRELGLSRPLLVGHSLGARIVAQAASAPGLAGGVVLLDGSRVIGGHAASVGEPAKMTLAQAIDATIGPFAEAAVRAQVRATMLAASPELAGACVRAFEAWDAQAADTVMASLGTVPLLAIQSTYHDRLTSRRSLARGQTSTPFLRFVREAAPHVRIALLPDTGHFAMLERPREVADLILAFAADPEGNR